LAPGLGLEPLLGGLARCANVVDLAKVLDQNLDPKEENFPSAGREVRAVADAAEVGHRVHKNAAVMKKSPRYRRIIPEGEDKDRSIGGNVH